MSKRRITVPEFKVLLADSGYPISTVTRKTAKEVSNWYNVSIPTSLFKSRKAHGIYRVAGAIAKGSTAWLFDPEAKRPVKMTRVSKPRVKKVVAKAIAEVVTPEKEDVASKGMTFKEGNFIPPKSPFYLKVSELHDDLDMIIKSGMWSPAYISGLSGNGKTMTPTQVGAINKREVIRVNITEETSEDDLLGMFRLIKGETIWVDGPVVVALKRGAILILDELDLGGSRIMCLQSVLENNGVLVKKTNEQVYPTKGFNVIATGNTKGKGDDGHGFINTNFLNEAMLDRFTVTFDHDYPSVSGEVKILKRAFKELAGKLSSPDENKYFDRLAKTAKLIRERYAEDGIEGFLTTRRLVDILKIYLIFGNDRIKAFELCTNRFDADTAGAMKELYLAVDAGAHDNDAQSDGLSPAGGNI